MPNRSTDLAVKDSRLMFYVNDYSLTSSPLVSDGVRHSAYLTKEASTITLQLDGTGARGQAEDPQWAADVDSLKQMDLYMGMYVQRYSTATAPLYLPTVLLFGTRD